MCILLLFLPFSKQVAERSPHAPDRGLRR
jgi:hypothetical protein